MKKLSFSPIPHCSVSLARKMGKEKVLHQGQGKYRGGATGKNSHDPYAQIVENAIFVVQDGRLKFANPRAREFLKQPIEKLNLEDLVGLVHPDDRAMVLGHYERRLRGEEVSKIYSFRLVDEQGQTRWVEVSANLIDWDRRPATLVLGEDITSRKQMELALRGSEEAARRLARENAVMAEITRIISSSLNIDEVYERFAEEIRKLLDFKNLTVATTNIEESSVTITYVAGIPVAGREVGTVVPLEGTSAEEVYKTRSSLFIQKENLAEAVRKIPMLRAAFEAGMQSMTIVPLISEGRVIGILNFLSSRADAYTRADLEIAEKVSAQISGAIANAQLFQELADYRARLEKMVEERSDRIQQLEQQRGEIEKLAATGLLAARIAHEINNPLAGIKGSFMLIQDAVPPEHPYRRYVGLIHSEINRIARIVRQMFELYRPPDEAQEEWELERMIQDILTLLKTETRERKVSFRLDLPATGVRLPSGPVRQVLFNILKNAVEASPVLGEVKISAKAKEDRITIGVLDQGPGIPAELRPHIFKPFFTTKKGKRGGLGLGLSISQEIVKSLGGTLHFRNLSGNGTLFQMTFPLKEEEERA